MADPARADPRLTNAARTTHDLASYCAGTRLAAIRHNLYIATAKAEGFLLCTVERARSPHSRGKRHPR
ncbi:hypothetical protein D3C85_1891440 [compost metagenome]